MPFNLSSNLRPAILTTLLVLVISLVFYLSWLPNPDFRASWYFPSWLVQWTNAHGVIRTAVPFVFLGALAEIYLYNWKNMHRRWIIIEMILLLIVLIAEAGQLFLPKRHFDWQDIICGGIGAAIGIALGSIFSAQLGKLK